MDDIRGFSRETLIGITTNIESQEARRRENHVLNFHENPRGGTTDAVENFFAISHRFLGVNFTLKEFKYGWRKIVRYYTSVYAVNKYYIN